MKNFSQHCEITREDFDSLFMWKVFWKLIRQETPFVFFLKVVSIAAFFMILILSIVLIGSFSGN
jgi:hypothetical protein